MAQSAPRVSVIVVLYNSGAVIGRCLDGLAAQEFRDFELILVDNESPQREIDHIVLPDNARVIRAGANLGFSGGNNLAARSARGRWLALLNPDAIPDPDWLAQLVAAAERHGAAAAGSLQVKDEDPSLLDGAGDVCHVSGLAWRGLFGRSVDEAPRDDCEVFGACAAAALYDRETFLALGGFYERFFCYYEDVDYAFRLRLAGHRTIHAAKARVRHVGSATSGGRHSDFAIYHGFRNTVWAFAKNMPVRWLPYALPLHIAMIAGLLFLNAMRGSARPALRGLRDALRGMGPVLADRRALQTAAKPGADLLLEWNPVAPFTRPAKTRPLR